MSTPRANYAGQRFGRLVVQSMAFDGRFSQAIVLCDCGVTRTIRAAVLKKGAAVSCGCYRSSRIRKMNLRHGAAEGNRSPEYRSWCSMIQRCEYSKHKSFARYGGRGIKVCGRWKAFENFLADMGQRPTGKTLDRYPNKDGNYEPGNCRWATASEQALNRNPRPRKTS